MSTFQSIVLHNELGLTSSFEHAIRVTMHKAWNQSKPNPPQEPDYVAMLVLEGTPIIHKTLQSLLGPHGISVSVASVFCHQRPMVEFNVKQRCELGDILFVHRHIAADGTISNNSLLLQAKATASSTHTITTTNDLIQLSLYQNWPDFEYFRTLGLIGTKRFVTPKASHFGAQYLLIDNSGPLNLTSGMAGLPSTYCMGVWPAKTQLFAHRSLANVLVDFLLGLNGRAYINTRGADATQWSEVVLDILDYGSTALFNRKNSRLKAKKRSTMDFSSWNSETGTGSEIQTAKIISGHSASPDGANDHPMNDNFVDDNNGGVSIVAIETREPKQFD